MTRAAARLVTAVVAAAGIAVALAAPAAADPHQICVVYDDDRSAYCVEFDLPPSVGGRLPR